MMQLLPIALIATALLFQAGPSLQIIRLGPTGAHLTADDVDQMTRIALKAGAKPWVVVGSSPGRWMRLAPHWDVRIYLQPDRNTGGVRRGRMQDVTAVLPAVAAYTASKSWQIESSHEWAQVPLREENADELVNNRDPNRPFLVEGALSDQDLKSIVSIVRANPTGPAFRAVPPQLIQVEGTWPFRSVQLRSDSTVSVFLLGTDPDEMSGQSLVLRKVGNAWVVSAVSEWVAD
jgi:hypothetical protein